ncbi:MAG: M20/M25/M40 family metallo-hydrolase [Ilumatobacteraceae bacterium]|nr:M20/M25/M40 family metallo-hydrolase [Ilumatobacteraceae bacterium]
MASLDDGQLDDLTAHSVELLQTLIRNACVNDGTAESGHEVRNADVLEQVLTGPGIDMQRYEPTPGRTSLVARIAGSDPDAPSLCLMGHTDVVPVNAQGWRHDPFGGELIDGEIWGRGAVDMLNLTSSMAVAVRNLADRGFRPRGDLIYFAVADEESGSAHGARWMADNERAAIEADYVLTENGGLHNGPTEAPFVGINVAEKGVAWRRLRVRGRPGHGSAPHRSDNALVTASAVVQRLAEYAPQPQVTELWRTRLDTLDLDDELRQRLLDPDLIDETIDTIPTSAGAAHLHACTHTTFSPNVVGGGHTMKTNVIPDDVMIEVDIRTLPGETADDVDVHLQTALGDLYGRIDIEVIMNDAATTSRIDTPLWDSLSRAITTPFPTARPTPQMVVGFTDARIYRDMGAVAYGAGLLSPSLSGAEFASRFHGHNERIDVESMALTTRLWHDVATDLLG